MKKEAYYFSHDSNARQDEKIIKLRMKLGWEGYGLFWALIEMLRDAKDYKLETDYDSIAFELRTECERIKSVIEDFGLFDIKKGMFYSTSLVNRMKLRDAKSNQAREAAKKRWAKKTDNQEVTSDSNADAYHEHSDSNAIKGKESKGNKNSIKTNKKFEFPVGVNYNQLSEIKSELFETWINYLYLEKKENFTSYRLNAIIKAWNKKTDAEVEYAVNDSLENGYKSLVWSRVPEQNKEKLIGGITNEQSRHMEVPDYNDLFKD